MRLLITIATAAVSICSSAARAQSGPVAATTLTVSGASTLNGGFQSPTANIGPSFSNGANNVQIPVLGIGQTANDTFENVWSVSIGGLPFSDNSTNTSASLNITGAPYGTYNAGCVLCVAMAGQGAYIPRAPVSGLNDYRSGAAAIPYGFDAVMETNILQNFPARLALQVSAYDSTGVTLSSSMTAAQMAQLAQNMYVITNSIDSTTPTTSSAPGVLPQYNYYVGIITGWTPTRISVAAWSSPATGNTASKQVPPVGNLDTYWTNLKVPTIFVGQPNQLSDHNEYLNYDGNLGTGVQHTFRDDEVDLRWNTTHQNEVHVDGITISAQPNSNDAFGDGRGLTSDSYGIAINGPLPYGLILNNGGVLIKSPAFLQNGQAGIPGNSVVGTTAESFEHDVYMDSVDEERLVGWLSQDNTTNGATGGGYHLGMIYNGNQGTVGTPQSQIVFAPGGQVGSIALFGQNGSGLTVASNGQSAFKQTLNTANVVVGSGNTLSLLPATGGGSGQPYMQATSPAAISFSTSAGGQAAVNIWKACFDTAGTKCLTFDGSSFVLSNGSTRLWSLNASTGNEIIKGTLTQSGTP